MLRHRAPHDNLEADITERALMAQAGNVTRALHAFRKRGLSIALDAFGTGYASLSYLRTLPLDVLKVDRGFVNEIGTSHSSSSLVRAILPMAQALGLECVGEGIETGAQRAFPGCQPVPGGAGLPDCPADVRRWLRPVSGRSAAGRCVQSCRLTTAGLPLCNTARPRVERCARDP